METTEKAAAAGAASKVRLGMGTVSADMGLRFCLLGQCCYQSWSPPLWWHGVPTLSANFLEQDSAVVDGA